MFRKRKIAYLAGKFDLEGGLEAAIMEIRFWLDLDESCANHARPAAAAQPEQMAKISSGSRKGLVSRVALSVGDRLIAWGRALKRRAGRPGALSSVNAGYAD